MAVDTQAVVLDMGDYWMEYCLGTATSIASGANKDETFTVLKPGRLVAVNGVMYAANDINASQGGVYINGTAAPNIGLAVITLRVVAHNHAVGANNMRVGYWVMMRR